jgi:coenzyme F420-0:L-glutamate ligase / coenzyme F420-1:gamma-L-glutamate ligase
MEHHEFLRSRRSARRFTSEDISDVVIDRMISSAVCAPSAHNRQPWRFCILKRLEAKTKLADAMAEEFQRDLLRDKVPAADVATRISQSRARIISSPLVVILCMDISEMDTYPDARRQEAERIMAIQSTAAAGLQLLLAAHAEGLAGVWTCGPLFAQDVVRRVLGLEASWEPQAMFFIGHADQQPKEKVLKPLGAIIRTY